MCEEFRSFSHRFTLSGSLFITKTTTFISTGVGNIPISFFFLHINECLTLITISLIKINIIAGD